jgi:hypothetical protein
MSVRSSLAPWLAVALALSLPRALAAQDSVSVTFEADAALFTLRDTFASVNVDSGSLHNLFNFADPVLTRLTANLARAAPTQLRVGGGAADNTLFTGKGGARGACSPPADAQNSTFGVDICVDEAYFAQLCGFAASAGVELVWDLNAALREWGPGGELGPWNSSNAEELFTFLAGPDRPPACPIAAWQLGNEMQDWYKRKGPSGTPMNISGAKLAADYATLRALLLEPRFASLQQSIYGPDACCEDRVTPPDSFMPAFAAAAAAVGSVDAVTIHIYPIPRYANNSCEPPLFTSKATFGSIFLGTLQYASWAAPLLRRGAPLIVGETATSAHGGCDDLSNRFVAGFALWFELGTYAELGVAQINRQDLGGYSSESEPSNYGLLGPPGWSSGPLGQPHPDYFSLLIFKQLVAARVLSSGFSSAANVSDFFDSHVFCAKGAEAMGGIVLTYLNMQGAALVLAVAQLPPAALAPRNEYVLTSAAAAAPEAPGAASRRVADWPPSLTADAVFLNDVQLATNADGSLPAWPIPGRQVADPAQPIILPPWSYGAIVFPAAGAQACMDREM